MVSESGSMASTSESAVPATSTSRIRIQGDTTGPGARTRRRTAPSPVAMRNRESGVASKTTPESEGNRRDERHPRMPAPVPDARLWIQPEELAPLVRHQEHPIDHGERRGHQADVDAPEALPGAAVERVDPPSGRVLAAYTVSPETRTPPATMPRSRLDHLTSPLSRSTAYTFRSTPAPYRVSWSSVELPGEAPAGPAGPYLGGGVGRHRSRSAR